MVAIGSVRRDTPNTGAVRVAVPGTDVQEGVYPAALEVPERRANPVPVGGVNVAGATDDLEVAGKVNIPHGAPAASLPAYAPAEVFRLHFSEAHPPCAPATLDKVYERASEAPARAHSRPRNHEHA